jgi:hypothetical protein
MFHCRQTNTRETSNVEYKQFAEKIISLLLNIISLLCFLLLLALNCFQTTSCMLEIISLYVMRFFSLLCFYCACQNQEKKNLHQEEKRIKKNNEINWVGRDAMKERIVHRQSMVDVLLYEGKRRNEGEACA